MKMLWISLRTFKLHEMHSTIRLLKRAGAEWSDIYTRLGEVAHDTLVRTAKFASGTLLLYLILLSFQDDLQISVTVADITAFVPAAYITLATSMMLLFLTLSLQNALMVIILRARQSVRHGIRGFNAAHFGLLQRQEIDNLALTNPRPLSQFIQERIPISGFLEILILGSITAMIVPIAAIWVFLLDMQAEIIGSAGAFSEDGVVSLAGQLVLGTTALFVILFNLPLPAGKNKNRIRWLFLSHLYPAGNHPRADDWLADLKKKTK